VVNLFLTHLKTNFVLIKKLNFLKHLSKKYQFEQYIPNRDYFVKNHKISLNILLKYLVINVSFTKFKVLESMSDRYLSQSLKTNIELL